MIKTVSLVGIAVAAVSFGSTGAARAEVPAPPPPTESAPPLRGEGGALEFGLRTGYGIPLGRFGKSDDAASDQKVTTIIKGVVPVWIDAGYRFNPRLYAGLSFQYGFGLLSGDLCSSGQSCSVSDLRLDANVLYHVTPGRPADLWLGFGVGYEWLELSVSAPGFSSSESAGAFEFANFQAGVEVAVNRAFALGPFASFSLGTFRRAAIESPTITGTMDVADKSLHEWLLFGVRGTVDLHI